ncbi:hypothetical protein BDZ94DRAFT_1263050 [Collybia nuda]|uniref:F-box domain-containing protein n=1 Tax=Collybia nuda TaxID=64659 RepID=A0A9P6CDH7_9AGAR|nr:hypothetical protein BDZ94DRAFT_1263050 [Collybia nuda]
MASSLAPIFENLTASGLRVLDDEDILQRIFEHFRNLEARSTSGRPVSQNNALLWAALTCKSFLNPVLNVLWYSMKSMIPLLKLLGPFHSNNGTYVIRGTIQPKDWERYNYYAYRVREFTYKGDNGDDCKLAFHTRVRIAQLWTSPLLPALRRFICPEVQAPGLFIHFLFLSPTIEYIELHQISDIEDEAIGTFLSTLVEGVPSLKHLSMSGWLSDQSLSFIPELKQLRSLNLSGIAMPISADLLRQIGTLESLSDFSIDLSSSSYVQFKLEGGFLQLRNLRLNASYSIARDVLTQIETPNLEGVQLVAPVGLHPSGWEEQCKSLLELISSRWSKLRSISLDHEGLYEHDILPTHVLSPLLQLSHLRSVEIRSFIFLTSSADVLQYALAWPCLQSLCLPVDPEDPTDVSFTTLIHLANLCPNLRFLQLPFDIGITPPLPMSPSPQHQLETLALGGSNTAPDFRSLILVARYIDRLFSSLKSLRRATVMIESYPWDKVEIMIHTFQAIRIDGLDPAHNPRA